MAESNLGVIFDNQYAYADADAYAYGEAHAYAYAYANAYANAYTYAYADADADGYADGDANAYADGDADGYVYAYAYANAHANAYGDADAYAYALRYLYDKNKSDNSGNYISAYYKSNQDGTPANGGNGTTCYPGALHEVNGPLEICTDKALHATLSLNDWEGDTLWLVKMYRPIIMDGNKIASLKREIVERL